MTFLPIVERELRIAARSPGTYRLRFLPALAAIIITLLSLAGMSSRLSPVYVAKEIFGILSTLTIGFCVFSGVFQTADCLSSEKRDGTLGLLFLTDLHGYDVVLGKLAANSLHSFYGLVSVLPVLAIPLLAGGVTGGEYWRMVVVLLAALFFSLGIGMFVSAIARDARQAMGGTVFLIILVAGILPAIYGLLKFFLHTNQLIRPLLWPSLGFAMSFSTDQYFTARGGPYDFWGSILTILGIGFSCLMLASLLLPRAWQEKNQEGRTARGGSRWRRLRFGSPDCRGLIRREMLDRNPFQWLAVRDRLSQIGFWTLACVALPLWLLFIYEMWRMSGAGFARMMPFELLILIPVILSLVFKCIVATESSRRLFEDRQSGALELLLVTPLSEAQIINGQRLALRRQFLAPIFLVCVMFIFVVWIKYGTTLLSLQDEGTFAIVMVGNIIALLADFNALGWVGMWAAMRCRSHHRAVLLCLLKILVVPWLLYFLMGVSGLFNSARSQNEFVCFWYFLAVANDLYWANLARQGLMRRLRGLATGADVKAPRQLAATLSQSLFA